MHMHKGIRCRLKLLVRQLLRQESSEVCRRCGADVGLWWSAPDALWLSLVGQPVGILCIGCFERLARSQGQFLHWTVMAAGGYMKKLDMRSEPAEDATHNENGGEDSSITPVRPRRSHPPVPPAVTDYHMHTCPSDGVPFRCVVRHREGTILLRRQEVALCPTPHRRGD